MDPPTGNEIKWKSLDFFELPDYEISSIGTIRNIKYNVPIDVRYGNGYNRFYITINGIRERLKISTLVAMAFIPNPDNKPIVDHIDRNALNDKVENLRWATYSENSRNRNYKNKPNPLYQIHNKNIIQRWLSLDDIAKYYSVDFEEIEKSIETKKHFRGYKWEYCKEYDKSNKNLRWKVLETEGKLHVKIYESGLVFYNGKYTYGYLNPSGKLEIETKTKIKGFTSQVYRIDSLVAFAFIGKRPNGNVILHKNLNLLDDRLENIKYCTRKELIKAYKNEGKYNNGTGFRSNSVPVEWYTKEGKLIAKFRTLSEAEKQSKMSNKTIKKLLDTDEPDKFGNLWKRTKLYKKKNDVSEEQENDSGTETEEENKRESE
jgi:hypothetical protein